MKGERTAQIARIGSRRSGSQIKRELADNQSQKILFLISASECVKKEMLSGGHLQVSAYVLDSPRALLGKNQALYHILL